MDSNRDLDNHRNNAMYYNQLLREDRTRENSHIKSTRSEPESFANKKVDFSDYLPVIEGYEGIFYTLYFISIPYISGAIFLFFFVAGGRFEYFMLLDFNSFLIVWMIGYEIVASLLLITIFISFFKHDNKHRRIHWFWFFVNFDIISKKI